MCSFSRFISYVAVVALLTLVGAKAQAGLDGNLDTTFGYAGTPGKVFINFDDGDNDYDDASAVAVQPDGKIIVAGTIDTSTTGKKAIGVARLLPDGHYLDTTFADQGKARLYGPGDDTQGVSGIVPQPDGKILLSGWFQPTGQNNKDMLVYRLNANGNGDVTFGIAGKVVIPFSTTQDDVLEAIALQPDGKIVGAGWTTWTATDHDFAAIRLNSNGSLDTSFAGDGKTFFAFDAGNGNDDRANALVIDPHYGSIVLVGSATSSNAGNHTDMAATRFSNTGAVDQFFGSPGVMVRPFNSDTAAATGVALSWDTAARIYTLSGYRQFSGVDYDFVAAQLDTDGVLTSNFGVQSYGIDLGGNGLDAAMTIVAENFNEYGQPNVTRWTLGGYALNSTTGNYDYAMIRVHRDGTVDTSFGNNGKTIVAFDYDSPPSNHNDFGKAMALQGHRVIIAGTVGRQFHSGNDADFGVARLTSDVIFRNGFEQ